MITLRKFATIALAMQDPAKTVSAQENSLALPDPHHTGVDTASYGNLMHTNPRLQSVPRRRLRQSSTLADKAAAPAPAMINEDTAPMIAPAPQSMTRVPGLVTKDKQFSVIDASCYKWTLPPGRYLEGEEASACCTTKTFAPYKEQIEVQNRDCCGVGTIKSTLVLSPGNSNSELPSQCCAENCLIPKSLPHSLGSSGIYHRYRAEMRNFYSMRHPWHTGVVRRRQLSFDACSHRKRATAYRPSTIF